MREASVLLVAMASILFGVTGAQAAQAVSVDRKSYDPACGVTISQHDEGLLARWATSEGSTELMLNLAGHGAVMLGFYGLR